MLTCYQNLRLGLKESLGKGKMGIKQIINRILFPNTYSSDAYVKYLRRSGVSIGDGTWFVRPKNTIVDVQKADFVEIGDNVCITDGVTILAHDWSYSVIARCYDDAPAKQRVTKIGNNVFIGMHAVILMGADIGDNVIIGAGSVIAGKVESNSVYAGNPAKKICSLEEHYARLKNSFEESTYIYLNRMKEKKGRYPHLENMGIHASLFVDKDEENMKRYFSNSAIPFAIKNMQKKYDSIEEFIQKYEGNEGKL